jgi:hypothetical protein
MFRVALALAVWVGFVTAVPATLAPRKDGPLIGKEASHFQTAGAPKAALAVVEARAQTSDYVVTDETEVLLNGKRCGYGEVPAKATILWMELGPDNRTVLKVYFRTAPATSSRPSGR